MAFPRLPKIDFRLEREWQWPAWKFKLKEDDLLGPLYQRFNMRQFPIHDLEAFHHDVYEMTCAAPEGDVEALYASLDKRCAQREVELYDAWRSMSQELVVHSECFADTEQWECFLRFSRTFSLDSLVAFIDTFYKRRNGNGDDTKPEPLLSTKSAAATAKRFAPRSPSPTKRFTPRSPSPAKRGFTPRSPSPSLSQRHSSPRSTRRSTFSPPSSASSFTSAEIESEFTRRKRRRQGESDPSVEMESQEIGRKRQRREEYGLSAEMEPNDIGRESKRRCEVHDGQSEAGSRYVAYPGSPRDTHSEAPSGQGQQDNPLEERPEEEPQKEEQQEEGQDNCRRPSSATSMSGPDRSSVLDQGNNV